ncbi:unnamed protein product, partial [Choristocarpus tenellus]
STANLGGSSTFFNNSADGHGGVLYASASSIIEFDDCSTFHNNNAGSLGGAVYFRNSSSLTLKGYSTFSGNSAGLDKDAGAIRVYDSSNLTMAG